jgi:uncharacterized repeat protein (TIGR01451 family)
MISLISWLRRKSLFLTIGSLSVITYGIIPTVAQTVIDNTASGGANNFDRVDSNNVTLTSTPADLRLTKTGDRAAAEPGDTVIYRLRVENVGTSPAQNVSFTDRLPLGLQLASRANQNLEGFIGDRRVNLTVNLGQTDNDDDDPKPRRQVTLSSTATLQPGESLVVSYAAQVTPDAIRGSGINLAQAQAGGLRSNQSSHRLRIRQGILSDCGTLIGRVFVDKNFDGEQQPNEPGVPNAVIYMDDGNRIVTDANGLYSLANVISGYRSAALDLTSLPGYSLAPNKYFIETNSPSRLVKLSPGSMVRVNFAVTPAFSEGKQ